MAYTQLYVSFVWINVQTTIYISNSNCLLQSISPSNRNLNETKPAAIDFLDVSKPLVNCHYNTSSSSKIRDRVLGKQVVKKTSRQHTHLNKGNTTRTNESL